MSAKKISLVLAVLLLLMSALVACGDGANKTDTGKPTGTNVTAGETTAEDLFYGYEYLPELSEVNGFEFKVYTRGSESGYGAWETIDLTSDGENEEPINDAVYKRNALIKEKYGFSIVDIESPKDQLIQAMSIIKSGGDDSFHMIIADGVVSAALGQGGYLMDLKTLPYLTLEAPWWDSHASKNLSIGGKLYFTTGDLSISANDATWVCAFNKEVQSIYEVEDLYKLVKEDKWTIDKVVEITKTISADYNDDGKYDRDDAYGYIYEPFNNYALFNCLGCSITSKNAEDYPVLSVYTSASQEIFEIIREISDDNQTYFQGWAADCTSIIKDNRALMTSTTMYTIRAKYRSWEQDFGILPMPKLNTEQEYINVVSTATSGSLYSVPTCAEADSERVAYCMEALCRESKDTLRPAYYDVTLQGIVMRDNESSEMLDIILASRYFDLSIIYNWGDWFTYFYTLWENAESNFASQYDAKKSQSEAAIQETIDDYINNF